MVIPADISFGALSAAGITPKSTAEKANQQVQHGCEHDAEDDRGGDEEEAREAVTLDDDVAGETTRAGNPA